MREIGLAIIGCGTIAPVHAQSIVEIPGAKLVAVSDVIEANARKLADRFGATPYTDYHEMIKRDDIQAVSLCVPSGMRAEIGEACAKAGKHILAEKPIEVSRERIDRLINAADKAKVLLGCIFQYRYADGPQHIRRAVEQGRFGKLVMGDAYIKWYRSPEYYASVAWRGTRAIDGGGALMNQGIHQIDLLLWFMGQVKSISAKTALIGHEGLEVEDLACALLEFQNGALGVIEGSTAIWPGHPARVEVHGTEGSAILEDGKLLSWKFKHERPEDAAIIAEIGKESATGSGASDPMAGLKHEAHRRQIEDFVNAIREGRPPAIDGREGRRAVEVIEAIYQAAQSGVPVNIA